MSTLIHIATLAVVLSFMGKIAAGSPHPLSDEFIDLINEKQSTWVAGRNFHQDTPMESFKNFMGLLENDVTGIQFKEFDANSIGHLPENFDPRDKWPHCESLNEIRDQADCGSCWAFAAVEAMTDRICIHSNGSKKIHVSATDAVSCAIDNGCQGGHLGAAWEYWQDHGVVSGGNYGSKDGCKPYFISPCNHHVTGTQRNCSNDTSNKPPECKHECQKSYNRSYDDDKIYGLTEYVIGENSMKAELFLNGPIQCSFVVYADFLTYKSGVYEHIEGDEIGNHAIKVIGWGVENGLDYWLCANSWNTNWGDSGFFKYLRGENHLTIEEACVTGVPDI